jgi:carbonic anhydrase
MNKFRLILCSLFGVFAFAVGGGAMIITSQAQQQTTATASKLPAQGSSTDKKKEKKSKRLTQTKETQAAMTPAQAVQLLKEGNERFVNGKMTPRDLLVQMKETSEGQYPFAVILSCQDSRTSNEMLFDLNKGDAFSLRIAGNVVNEDILGGMEFGTKVAGAKTIAVIGHTKCGAINGACDDVKLGNLTGLLGKIKPAVANVPTTIEPRTSKNPAFVKAVTEENVRYQMSQISEKSPLLKEMIAKGEINVVGGVYDISTGKIEFLK